MEDPALGVAHVRRGPLTGGVLTTVAHRAARPADPAGPVSGFHRLLDAVKDRGAVGAVVMLAALPVKDLALPVAVILRAESNPGGCSNEQSKNN